MYIYVPEQTCELKERDNSTLFFEDFCLFVFVDNLQNQSIRAMNQRKQTLIFTEGLSLSVTWQEDMQIRL